MYGLVNRAIEQMVTRQCGPEMWQQLCRDAELETTTFVAQEAYDDAVTYRLVAAASSRLNMPADAILKAFGEFWITYTAQEGYSHLLTMCGDNIRDFLYAMNDMHARIELSYPRMRPPHFDLIDIDANTLELHYHSEREGLAPMVVGLLEGLAKRFNQRVEIEHSKPRTAGSPVDHFCIRLV